MKKATLSFVRRAITDQGGQTLPFVALMMTALLGVAGLVVDVGHAYVIRGQLQNAANASALAAAGYVYYSSSATVNSATEADLYGGGTGGKILAAKRPAGFLSARAGPNPPLAGGRRRSPRP